MNCKIISVDMTMLYNDFCTGFIVSIYQTAICILIASMFSFFGVLFIFCLAKRITSPDDNIEQGPREVELPPHEFEIPPSSPLSPHIRKEDYNNCG